ncbi:MAG: carboxylesterase/lipase family protein [Solobacterium sp.]|nr:carboxylesterase/lipase family protein [Solobacterium sp.]
MTRTFICTPDEPVVETKAGKVRGFKADSTYTFYGIKYANAKRWEMPTEVEPWEGTVDALSYGYVCPMVNRENPFGDHMVPHRYWPKDEACQYLNIWTQSIDRTAKKPVLVWIHGGQFMDGSSIEMQAYDGVNISEFGDVVFVSMNHRLNIIGYLDLSSFSDTFWNSGNVGNADLVMCLKWVHDNIEGFGGDPDNVTIMGQSGGGRKVQSLLQIPAADGLFHKAFIMSGISDFRRMFGNPETAKEDARAFGEALYKELGIDYGKDPLALQDVPYDTLAAAWRKLSPAFKKEGRYCGCFPMKNDWYAGDPLYYGFREHAYTIPLMAGTCLAERGTFGDVIMYKHRLSREQQEQCVYEVFGKEDGQRMIEAFSEAYPGRNLIDAITLDNNYRIDTKTFVKTKAAGTAPCYNYLFAYDFPINGGKAPWHCSDIPFWFRNTDKVPVANRPGVSDVLENKMSSCLISFAKTGAPCAEGLPEWPASTPDELKTMILAEECGVTVNHDDKLIEVFWPIRPDLSKYNKNNISLH